MNKHVYRITVAKIQKSYYESYCNKQTNSFLEMKGRIIISKQWQYYKNLINNGYCHTNIYMCSHLHSILMGGIYIYLRWTDLSIVIQDQ